MIGVFVRSYFTFEYVNRVVTLETTILFSFYNAQVSQENSIDRSGFSFLFFHKLESLFYLNKEEEEETGERERTTCIMKQN